MMILPLRDAPELGGSDPIDARIGSVPAFAPPGPRRQWLRPRLALGLTPTPVPGLVLLPVGIALGPHGIGVLSPTALSYLDPVIAVALTALGTFIGLGLSLRTGRELHLCRLPPGEPGGVPHADRAEPARLPRSRLRARARPYGFVRTRGSRITTIPLSRVVRISRPNPCLSFRTASGSW